MKTGAAIILSTVLLCGVYAFHNRYELKPSSNQARVVIHDKWMGKIYQCVLSHNLCFRPLQVDDLKLVELHKEPMRTGN
jgi:hypothetical protein